MAANEEERELDFAKMKVAELKRELKNRGLSTAGNKMELIERLQSGMNGNQDLILDDTGTLESEILDEDEVLGDGLDDEELASEADVVLDEVPKPNKLQPSGVTTANLKRKASSLEKSETKPPERLNKKIILVRNPSVTAVKEDSRIPEKTVSSDVPRDGTENENKKIIKLSGLSLKERLELRAQKFGSPQSDLSKKEARANRFSVTGDSSTPNVDVLRKRAERFGLCVSPVAIKAEQEEKLKARRERFGLSTASTKPVLNKSLDEKKRLRAERFKIV